MPVLTDEDVGIKSVLSDADVGVEQVKIDRQKRREYLLAELAKETQAGVNTEGYHQFLSGLERIIEPFTAAGMLNQPARLTGQPDPYKAGAQIVPAEAVKQAVEFISPGGKADEGSAAQGVQQLAAQTLAGFTTPEMFVEAPAVVASPLVRGASAGQMAYHLPGQVGKAVEVAASPTASAAEKVVAIGEPAVTAAMTMGLAAPSLKQHPITAPAALAKTWEGFKTLARATPERSDMAAHFDAAENLAKITGAQQGNTVKLSLPNELDRQAMTFVIEAKGDIRNLTTFEQQAAVGDNAAAGKAIRHAKQNWNRLRPIADEVSDMFEQQRLLEQAHGVDTDYVEGYVKHSYDMDLMMGVNRPVILAGRGGAGISSAFKKQRAFQTYGEAIEAGYTPKTLDIAMLMQSRVTAGNKMINRMRWGDVLRQVVDPTNRQPIITDLIRQPKGTYVPPPGYVPREVLPGIRVAVHQGYERIFDALTGKSAIAESLPGSAALKIEGGIKHGLLAFDTFHASRMMQKQLFLTGRIGYDKGKTLLEFRDADLNEAVRQGEITREMADYARQNRPTAEILLREGLNVGKIGEALYADVVRNVPVIGKFNKWVFDKLTRGAMMESGIIEFNRVAQQNPGWTPQQVARKVSKDLNFYFGNIGRQGVFKSQTFQDALRLTFLAPQWVEGMAQTELRAAGQLARVPYDLAAHKTWRTGTLAKGVGQGLAAYFVATQILNLATRKQFTWENQEEGHKLDAWIPDATGKTPGYFISPFSVVAEVTHDFIRYNESKGGLLDAMVQIGKNKLSPLARSVSVLATGKDYAGAKLDSTWERVKEAGWSLAPIPIGLSGVLPERSYPGQAQRQLAGSLGLKIELAPSAAQQIAGKARDFNEASGHKDYVDLVFHKDSPYFNMRRALRSHDDAKALEALQRLRKIHRDPQIFETMLNAKTSAFTGSRVRENAFRKTLNAEEKLLYEQARRERNETWQQFLTVWRNRGPRPKKD